MMAKTPPGPSPAPSAGWPRRPDRTADLARMRVPTLVLVGEDDVITPPDEAKAMAEAIPERPARRHPRGRAPRPAREPGGVQPGDPRRSCDGLAVSASTGRRRRSAPLRRPPAGDDNPRVPHRCDPIDGPCDANRCPRPRTSALITTAGGPARADRPHPGARPVRVRHRVRLRGHVRAGPLPGPGRDRRPARGDRPAGLPRPRRRSGTW